MKNVPRIYLLIVIFIISGCKNVITEIEPESIDSSSGIGLSLHKAPSHEGKYIGMRVSYDLKIINPRPFPIEFAGFIDAGKHGQSFFAFTPPNAVHLIAPNGEDLLAAYSQESSVLEQPFVVDRMNPAVIEQFEPFRIEANSERWQRLTLGPQVVLDQPGTYTFWVELEDNFGQLHQSNKVDFTLEDIEPSVPLELLELEIRLDKNSYTIAELLDVGLEYSFKNLTDETVTFIRRLSFNTPVQSPVFELVIHDSKGRMIPIILSDAPGYVPIEKLHYIPVHPGEQHFQKDYLPFFPGMYTPGEYTIQLIYYVYETDILSGEPLNWDESVFIGRLKSNEVALTVEE